MGLSPCSPLRAVDLGPKLLHDSPRRFVISRQCAPSDHVDEFRSEPLDRERAGIDSTFEPSLAPGFLSKAFGNPASSFHVSIESLRPGGKASSR